MGLGSQCKNFNNSISQVSEEFLNFLSACEASRASRIWKYATFFPPIVQIIAWRSHWPHEDAVSDAFLVTLFGNYIYSGFNALILNTV